MFVENIFSSQQLFFSYPHVISIDVSTWVASLSIFTPPMNPHFIVPTSQSLMPFVPPPSLAIHHALDSPSWTKSSTIALMASKASISTPSIDGDASTSCSIVLPMRTHPMITRSQNNIDKSKQLFQATENPSQNQWNHICYLSP